MPTLDTSFLIDLIRHKPEALIKIDELEDIGIPLATTAINILELYKGVYQSMSIERNMVEVKEILRALIELDIDESTYDVYGTLSAELKKNGNSIGDFDELIAAITLCNDGIIVTRDHHFSKVSSLKIETY